MKMTDRIENITLPNNSAKIKAHEEWSTIAKPLGSFGKLEYIIEKIAGIQGTEYVDISKRTAVIMCADNGVVEEGVSQVTSEVTAICAVEIAEGRSNINAVADEFNIDVLTVDIGIKDDYDCSKIIDRKIARGTKNICYNWAMSKSDVNRAICIGMDMIKELKENGTKIVIAGEMGIGNTTTAAAVASAVLDLSAESVTTRGAGLSYEAFERKIDTVDYAVRMRKPDRDSGVDVLAKLGGFDIAGMAGLFLGGAYYKLPVIIDGLISSAAAVIAYKMNPKVAEYMIPSHYPGRTGKLLLESIGLEPVIDGGLRLGEGTGGALLIPLLDGALALYRNSHRFDDINIDRYREQQ